MLKQLFFLSAFLLIFSLSNAQTADPRLSAVYSEEYLTNLTINRPSQLRYLNWCLDNSYEVIELSAEKVELLPFLKNFDPTTKTIGTNAVSIDENAFNLYLYSFERKYNSKTTYRIGSTGLAIVFDSEKNLAKNFNIYENEQ
jgi:hypothetical protein